MSLSNSRIWDISTETTREGVRWALKSGIGLSLNLLLLTVWVDYFGIAAELAIFINWFLLSIYGYLLTQHWVFDKIVSLDNPKSHFRQYLGMQSILAASKVLNYIIYVALIWIGLDYRLSWVVGAVVGFAVSFGGNKAWWTR